MTQVAVKRIYEPIGEEDGLRVLVDGLWPRGLRKEDASFDLWIKEVAPSPALRRWYGHDAAKFEEFGERYRRELADNPAVERLSARPLTLLTSTRDAHISHAEVLRSYLT